MHTDKPRPIRVAIVDDHLIVRQGLHQYLAEFEDITWVGEAEDGVAALALIASTPVDVVLLDLSLPHKHGLEVLPEIRARYPAIQVVVLTGYPESHYGDEAKPLGAAAYLHKECEPLEIVAAIRAAGRRLPGAANESTFA